MSEIENAYLEYALGNIEMPPRTFVYDENDGDFVVGSTYFKNQKVYVARVSSYVTDIGINGFVGVFNSETGKLTHLVADQIVQYRTGAKGGVAVNYLAKSDADSIGLLGMGTQAKTHLEAICQIRDIKRVSFWSRTPQKHNDLVNFAKKLLNLEVLICDNPDECVKNKDIVIDATFTKSPLVQDKSISNGAFIIGMNHAPSSTEFDGDTLERSQIFVDILSDHFAGTIQNCIDSGIIKKSDVVGDLSQVINKEIDFDKDSGNTIYFHSSGCTLEDGAGAIAMTKMDVYDGEFEL
jgi:ornithine cyclodeaminase/alanine dehydrogenase-like protein (mu-crystallin family)